MAFVPETPNWESTIYQLQPTDRIRADPANPGYITDNANRQAMQLANRTAWLHQADTQNVKLSGTQTIAGEKTFNNHVRFSTVAINALPITATKKVYSNMNNTRTRPKCIQNYSLVIKNNT